MGQIDDFLSGGTAASSSSIDDFLGEQVKPKGRSAADYARDGIVTAGKGAVGLPQAFVGIADIPTGGRFGQALEGIGYRPDEAQKFLDSQYSAQTQADKRYVNEADGFFDTISRAVERPATIATAVGESIPSMIGGAGIARSVLKAAPKLAPVVAGAIGEGAIGAGSAAEQIRGETKDGLLTPTQSLSAVGSGVGTGILGFAGGKLAQSKIGQKLGVSDVDTMLASGHGEAISKNFVRQVVASGVSEGVFEEMPQSAQEQMWQNFATGKPVMEGVANASAMGMLAGAAMGGAGGGYNATIGKMQPADAATPGADAPAAGDILGMPEQGGGQTASTISAIDTQIAATDLNDITAIDSLLMQRDLIEEAATAAHPAEAPAAPRAPSIEAANQDLIDLFEAEQADQRARLDTLNEALKSDQNMTIQDIKERRALENKANGLPFVAEDLPKPDPAIIERRAQAYYEAGTTKLNEGAKEEGLHLMAQGDAILRGEQPAPYQPIQPTEQATPLQESGANRPVTQPEAQPVVSEANVSADATAQAAAEVAQPAEPPAINVRTAPRRRPASDSLVQAIINRGGINRSIMSDVGADMAGRYQPGLFTSNGTTDLSELAGLLFDEDGFHQINQTSDIGPARELEELIGRALGGERILNTDAAERDMQAEIKERHKQDVMRLADEYGVPRSKNPRDIEKLDAKVAEAINAEISNAGDIAAKSRDDALAAGMTEDEVSAIEDAIVDSDEFTGEPQPRDAMVKMWRKITKTLKEQINDPARSVAQNARAQSDQVHDAAYGASNEESREGTRPAEAGFALEQQSEADLAAKVARENDQALADKETADAQREAFTLSRPAGSAAPKPVPSQQNGLFNAKGEAKQAPSEKVGADETAGRIEKALGGMRAPDGVDVEQAARGLDARMVVIDKAGNQPKLSRAVPPAPTFKAVNTESPAFIEWFGDSKVVDADGKPLVVYHGTAEDFAEFDASRAGQEQYSDWGNGIYFTPSPSNADYYRGEAAKKRDAESDRLWNLLEAEEKKTTWANGTPTYTEEHGRLMSQWRKARATAEDRAGSVMPVFLSIKNPLIQEYASTPDPYLADRAKAAGHDGIIVLNGNGGIDEIVAFEPTQIKSAISNTGEFDPSNLDIRMSRGAGRGMALRDLQAVVDRVAKGFKNLPKVHVFESPAALSTKDPSQKALRDYIKKQRDAMDDANGAFHDGVLYLFASGMTDEAQAEHVLATHEITHYGLRGAIGADVDAALQHIYINNAVIRKAADQMRKIDKGITSNVEAVEEVLADMPTADLMKFKGWRRVMKAIRDWLSRVGAKNLSKRLNDWMTSGLSGQEKADLFVADLVMAAREWVRTGKGGSRAAAMVGTRLADQRLSDDWAEQEKWLDRGAKARGYKTIDELAEKAYPVFEKLAALWRGKHPVEVSLLSRAPFRAVDVFGNGSLVEHYDDVKGLMFSRQQTAPGKFKWTAWDVFPQSEGGNQVIGEMFAHNNLEDAIASVRGARISAALRARVQAKYGSIPSLWSGEAKRSAKALIDAGIGIERFASSTQSKSKYIYTDAGTKIRLADHALPSSYDAADVDYRYGGDVNEMVAAVLEREGAPTPSVNPDNAGSRSQIVSRNEMQERPAVRADESGSLEEPAQSGGGAGSNPMLSRNVGAGKTAFKPVDIASAAFKRWFGDSKVVDADGKPLVVYHYSNAKNIEAFSGSGLFGNGPIYFNSDPKAAKKAARGKNVEYPVYLRMQNPINTPDTALPWHKVDDGIWVAEAKRAGYDGVYVKDEGGVSVAVFDPTQIKSATSNTGEFSNDNPDIRFSRAVSPAPATAAPLSANLNPWQKAKAKAAELLTPERLDRIIYEMQDKYIDLRRLRDHIKAIGGVITDLNDAYLGEEMYHKRVAKRTKDFLEKELKPLIADMRSRAVSMQEMEKFLHARHAPEANAAMAKRNPTQAEIDAGRKLAADEVKALELQLQGAKAKGTATKSIEQALNEARGKLTAWNGAQAFQGSEAERLSLSGMSDNEAKVFMAGLPPAKRAHLEALAAKVDAINAGTLDSLEKYGLMDKTSLDAWRGAYQHYVPLHRDEAHPDSTSHPIGQGFSTKGDAAKRRTGSNAKVTNILGHIAMQRESALTRGEKNHVMRRLYLMAKQNPLPDVWSTDKVPTSETIDKKTGFVQAVIDPLYKTRPNILMLRIAGKDVAIVMNESNPNALRMAQALKNLDVDDLHYLIPFIGKFTRYFASINTQYNPIFGAINFMRDFQAAALQLSTTELIGSEREVMKDTLAIMGQILKNKGRLPKSGKWAAVWEDLQNVGGTTGYRDLYLNAEDRAESLLKEIKALDRGNVSKAAHAVADWLSDYNEAMENAVRLAAYRAALNKGLSKERAASVAKNVTVNFNRKGRQTREIGALYAFFNAAVQGTTRMAQTLSGPRGKQIMAGGVLLGAISAIASITMMGGDGDDDEYSKIPEFVRERAMVIPIGEKRYIAIPMPLGFHFLPNIGRLAVEMFHYQDKTVGSQLASLFTIMADAFNPLGGAPIEQIVAPTVADPFIALLANKDWTGKSIYLENYNALDPEPGHKRTKNTATAWSKAFAEAINAITGGTQYTPGAWSPTPDQLDFVIGQLTGGVGRELGKISQTATAKFTGDELPPHKIPLIGRLYGTTDGVAGQSGKFYDNIKLANEAENELKGRLKDGLPVDDYLKAHPGARELVGRGNQAEKHIRLLREMGTRPGITREEKREIGEKTAAAMMAFNKEAEKLRAQAM